MLPTLVAHSATIIACMSAGKKRGNNEGSVYQEGARSGKTTGRWIAQVSVNGVKRRAVASTEAKAKQRLRQMQSQIEHGTTITDGNLTVQQVLDQWTAKALPNRNLQQPTLEVHRWAREILIEDIGGKRARNLMADDVEEAFQRRADAGLSRNSLIKLRSTLSQALAWAQRRGLVASNVAAIVELPADARGPQPGRSMTADQARAFLRAARGTWLEAMWMAMLYLGLRPGEVAALSWDDIDFDHHIIHVRRARKRNRGTITIGTTKTTGSVRSLNAPGAVIDALQRRRHDQQAEQAGAADRWNNPENLVFTNVVGSPTDPPKVRTEFNQIIDAAELGDGWTPSMLRHSAASLMSDAGIPLERIADQLGHKDTRMLANHYRHQVRPTIDAALILDYVLNPRET
jgi:integrase